MQVIDGAFPGAHLLVHLLRAVCQRLEKAVAAHLRRGQQRHPASAADLHVAYVRRRLVQRGHQPTSAEHLVGARGHLVDEHDDARCARRAAWLRSCAICPTWRGLAYVSSVFARTIKLVSRLY